MEFLPLLLIVLLCLGVGAAVGMLVTKLSHSKAPVSGGPDPNLQQAAGIWQDSVTGGLLVEMDGTKFHSVHDLNDNQRQRLASVVRDLRIWSGIPEPVQGGEGASVPRPEARGASQVDPAAVARSPGRLPAQPAGDTFKRPSLNPVEVVARALRADAPKPENPPMSIAGQIDEILQAKLENSSLEGRAIRLVELPGKGMVVMVGLAQYDSVSAVPDPEIRNLLQACVEEWEGRHT